MEKGELHPANCMIETREDGAPTFTFHIHDEKGDRVLVIDESNWTEAYES